MLSPYFCNPNYCDSRLKDHLLIGKTWVKKTCIFLQSYILEIVYLYVYNSYIPEFAIVFSFYSQLFSLTVI